MASLLHGRKGYLVVQFYYQRQLCREYLGLQDTRDNRRDQKEFLKKLEAALRMDTFEYAEFFPESTNARKYQPAPERNTLLDYFNSYLETLEISEATRYDLECLRREYIERSGLGAKLLNEVTPAQIRAVLKQAKDEGKQRRPVVFLQRLRSMYDAAIEDEMAEKNPARRIKNPKRRERAQIIPSFTEAEQAKLLQVAQGQDRNFITVMLGTAIGPGELCAIRPEDVDLQAAKIAVAGSLGRFGEGATKTPGRTRIVEIHDLVAPVTAALREQLKVQQLRGPLFANNKGGFLNYTNWRSRNWKSILCEAGITYRGPYACRHTYAVRMLQHRYDPVHVARQMGHSSTEMIHRHYARWIVGESTVPPERKIV